MYTAAVKAHTPDVLLSYEEPPGAVGTVNRWIDERLKYIDCLKEKDRKQQGSDELKHDRIELKAFELLPVFCDLVCNNVRF